MTSMICSTRKLLLLSSRKESKRPQTADSMRKIRRKVTPFGKRKRRRRRKTLVRSQNDDKKRKEEKRDGRRISPSSSLTKETKGAKADIAQRARKEKKKGLRPNLVPLSLFSAFDRRRR